MLVLVLKCLKAIIVKVNTMDKNKNGNAGKSNTPNIAKRQTQAGRVRTWADRKNVTPAKGVRMQ